MVNRTTIMISHRMSSVLRMAHTVVVIGKPTPNNTPSDHICGSLVEIGAPSDLALLTYTKEDEDYAVLHKRLTFRMLLDRQQHGSS